MRAVFQWIVVAGTWACGADPAEPGVTDESADGGEADGGGDGGDGGDDGDGGDGGDDTGDVTDPPTDPCEVLSMPRADLQAGSGSTDLYAVLSPFTVETTDGTWSLEEQWSGCEIYMFVQDNPRQATDWPSALWDRDTQDLFDNSPKNVHWFFVSTERSEDARAAALSGLKERVDYVLGRMSDDDQAWWNARVHYVTGHANFIEGPIGDLMVDPGWGVGVDRTQRIRYVGSYADPTRYNGDRGWFEPNLGMAANEPRHYNYEALRDAELASHAADVTRIFDGEECRGSVDIEVELPSAEVIATYDTLELDVTMACVGEGEYGTCPAWDYMAYLYLCDDLTDGACGTEVGRWITTYHREGRWVHDISPMLPMLAEGGARRFRFATSGPYEITADLHFSNLGAEARPEELTWLFGGGNITETSNDSYDDVLVEVPADATKVELISVITQHGMDSNNCGEFCDISHHFYVNGYDNERSFPEAETSWGCSDQVDDGTIPNQYGTWWYGRAGWCPGKHVDVVRTDITEQVVLGAENVFDYAAYYDGAAYPGSATNRLSSWVLVSR